MVEYQFRVSVFPYSLSVGAIRRNYTYLPSWYYSTYICCEQVKMISDEFNSQISDEFNIQIHCDNMYVCVCVRMRYICLGLQYCWGKCYIDNIISLLNLTGKARRRSYTHYRLQLYLLFEIAVGLPFKLSVIIFLLLFFVFLFFCKLSIVGKKKLFQKQFDACSFGSQ